MDNCLKFKDGKFKILVFSDLYENTQYKKKTQEFQSEDTALFIEASVKAFSPDLVVFNGDSAFGDDEPSLRSAVENITKTVKKQNIPLAVVFGDEENDKYDISKLIEIYSEYDNSLFNICKDSLCQQGEFNALIHNDKGEPKYNLWFFNSNGSTKQKDISSKYDWIHDDQIEKYEKKAKELKNIGVTNSLVFQHIPVVEEYLLMKQVNSYEQKNSVKGDGFFSDRHFSQGKSLYGSYRDPIGCSDFNNGQFESWKNTGDVKAAFFSNSHLNDFEGYLDNILLSQCCASGFKGCHDGDRVGVKLITLKEKDLSFETRNYHFSDFGLKSKSVLAFDSKLSNRQKKKIALVSITGAAAGISAVILSRLFDKE